MTINPEAGEVVVRGISFPQQLGVFVRGQIIDNEAKAPGLGVTVPYHGERWGEATVYVYDLGIAGIPGGTLSSEVRSEFDRTVQEMLQIMQQRGAVDFLGRWVFNGRAGPPSFLSAGYAVDDGRGQQHSYVFLTGAMRSFVKLRLTCRASEHSSKIAGTMALAVANRLQPDANKMH